MSFLAKLHDIDTFIFDVDGVLTNSMLQIEENGNLLRSMNVKDGFAVKYALAQGYKIFIITGGTSTGVVKRLEGLGIPTANIHSGAHDKLAILRELVKTEQIELGTAVYMGDDLPDYGPMRLMHLPTCPKDAIQQIKDISQYVSSYEGGKGCVRDIIEKVLIVQKKWFNLDVVNL